MKTALQVKCIAAATALVSLSAGAAQASCHVFGTAADDTLSSSVPCVIAGFAGDDTITGSAGDDEIFPGSNVASHSGHDTMTGGGGADGFVFEPSGSIGPGAAVITDFQHGTDQVFVFPVCWNASVTCFWSSGSSFSGTAGETIYTTSGSVGTIAIDLDGDTTADYQIKLSGAPTFDSGDISFNPPPRFKEFLASRRKS